MRTTETIVLLVWSDCYCSDLWPCQWMVIVPSLCTIIRRLCRVGAKSSCTAGNLGCGYRCWVTEGRTTAAIRLPCGLHSGPGLGLLLVWWHIQKPSSSTQLLYYSSTPQRFLCIQYAGHSFKGTACLLSNLSLITILWGITSVILIFQIRKPRALQVSDLLRMAQLMYVGTGIQTKLLRLGVSGPNPSALLSLHSHNCPFCPHLRETAKEIESN